MEYSLNCDIIWSPTSAIQEEAGRFWRRDCSRFSRTAQRRASYHVCHSTTTIDAIYEYHFILHFNFQTISTLKNMCLPAVPKYAFQKFSFWSFKPVYTEAFKPVCGSLWHYLKER